MGARTGEEFLEGLRSRPRNLWLGHERVEDVTEHPYLACGARALASIFDLQHRFADDCLFPDPETGELLNVSHMTPRSKEDLLHRRRGLERVSAATVGMMGRDPGYDNICFAGFVGEPHLWKGDDERNVEGWENLVAFQKYLRRADLSTTHALVLPTIDKARENLPVGHPEPMHKVGETADSIVVRGARALATLAPYADELVIWSGHPLLQEGVEPYTLSFAIPIDTPGLHFICRDSLSTPDADPFDRPLSTRFDEMDCFVIFDDVEVPKDRVFINGDPAIYAAIATRGLTPNMQQHTTVRALTKLEFAYGLASQMADAINDKGDATIDMLGELLTYIELTRSAILLSEEHAYDYGGGVWFPDSRPFDPIRVMMPQWLPRAFEIIKLIGRHNLLVTPSRGALDNPELRPLLDIYVNSANDIGAEARAELFRLAWDFVGSGLGGRQDLYERFYLGSAGSQRRVMYMIAQNVTSKDVEEKASTTWTWTPAWSSPTLERANALVDGVMAASREAREPSESVAVQTG